MKMKSIIWGLTEEVADKLAVRLDSNFPQDFVVERSNDGTYYIHANIFWEDSSEEDILHNYCVGYIDSLEDNK